MESLETLEMNSLNLYKDNENNFHELELDTVDVKHEDKKLFEFTISNVKVQRIFFAIFVNVLVHTATLLVNIVNI